MIAELKSSDDLIVRAAVACASRPSELLALRWRDVGARAYDFLDPRNTLRPPDNDFIFSMTFTATETW